MPLLSLGSGRQTCAAGHAAGEPMRGGVNHPRRVGVAAESGQLGELVGRSVTSFTLIAPVPMVCLMKFCEMNAAFAQNRP